MAIDTQQKRMSAAGCGRPYMRAHFPGTINQAWRIAAGNAYSGNTLVGLSWTSTGKFFLFTQSEWATAVVYQLETSFRSTDASEVGVRLYDVTAAATVSGSEITKTSTTMARHRSSALTLVDGHEYRVQVGVDGSAGAILGASVLALAP